MAESQLSSTDARASARTTLEQIVLTAPPTTTTSTSGECSRSRNPDVCAPIDANGNLISDGTKTYHWNALNQLVEVKEGTTTIATFEYDGKGRRTEKIAAGLTHTFIYDVEDIVEERITGSSSDTIRFFHGAGIDEPLARKNNSDVVTYYLADHLGSIVQESSAAGALTFQREYDPWGVASQGASTSGYAYTGREWDAELNLYYYRARYYEPNSGQFINEDPIGLLGGQSNLSGYVGNRPTGAIDPFGLCSEQPGADQDPDPDTVVREYMRRIRNAPDEETRDRVLRELLNDPDVKVSEAGMSGLRRLALEAAKQLLGRRSLLFGTRGILNSGRPNLRIGHSRDGGDAVFRIAGNWVEKYVPRFLKTDDKHIIIKNLGPLGK